MDCLCRPSRIMTVRINLLDETDFIHEIKDDLPGQALLDVIFARLNLIETSYFGIRYIDEENQTHWLEPASRISRQLKPKSDPYDLYFGVKFYAADPCKLLEEITRYQLFLQVKQDVLQGRLPVPFELAAELGAFVVQSELGDYDQRRHSKGYVSEFRLLPQQSSELEQRVAELHQQLKGMSPAQAEMNYLDKVKWHDMYGVDLHPVLGEDSVEYFLGLTPSGIVVLRNKTTVAHYYWPRIAKVYYKGRYFMLRISDKNNELSTYGFETPRKPACKHLWRCCVEHHAFFRAVRVAPIPNSQSNTSDLFQLGSRLKYNSGRSEKQAAKDALNVGRAPPAFTRVPSKRQPRRVIDDFLNGGSKRPDGGYDGGAPLLEKHSGIKANMLTTTYESPYRSTYSIPTSLGIRPYSQQQSYQQSNNGGNSNLQTPDSPRSTRSAPWPRSQQRSLFGNNPSSPRSVRSASTTGGSLHHHHHSHHHHHHQQQNQAQSRHQSSSQSSSYHNQQQQPQQQRDHVPTHQQRYRSSSVESHSSNDSRSTRRHKHRRRTSDNESELSRGSGRSGRSHHRKHRRNHRHRRDSVGSDRESSRGRSYSGHRTSSARSGSAELIDSTSQWREVQRRQAEASLGLSSVQQASVSKSSMVARSLHSNDSHSDTHSHHKSRRHRKNKSPSDSRNRMWNSELAKHLQFDLVDTAGMTEDQLREIPYTVVETNSKRSTSNIKIHKSNSKNSVGGKSTGSGNTITNGSNSTKEQGKNRVDRIRGLYFQNSNPSDSAGAKNGSIRSASTISSRECERNTGLVRMMSSMSMGDFISPTGSNLSPLENCTLRVSHEHTDSGLGADQDYAYSSERSSDSTRYGTNKSSGASSGSHRKCPGPGNSSTYNSLMQQTVSSQQQQKQTFPNQHQQQQQQQQTYFSQRQNSQKHNYKYSSSQLQQQHQQQQQQQQQTNPQTNQTQTSLAPIHNSHSHYPISTNSTNNNSINSNPNNGNGNEKGQHKTSNNSSGTGTGSGIGSGCGSISSSANRLLNYTTFENNQYKFSLNNAFRRTGSQSGVSSLGCGGGINSVGSGYGGSGLRTNNQMDHFVEWPHTPAAPYYYNGPSTSSTTGVKRRDAKSDIGVPTRRLSGQAMTKTQLLSGQMIANASCYPMPTPAYSGKAFDSRLHPAKSDLFLPYLHTTPMYEYERPYIYNYQMPQMPEFARSAGNTSEQQHQQQQQQQYQQSRQQPSTSAYHISGIQTADPPPPPSLSGGSAGSSNSSSLLYGGATPATDVLYYQFDNGKCKSPPIVHQPKSLLNKTTGDATTMSQLPQVGPLVYLQHGQNVAAITSQQTTTYQRTNSTNSTNSQSHSTCSEEDIDECDEDDIDEQADEQATQHEHEQTTSNVHELKQTTDSNAVTIKSIMATTPNNNSSNAAIQLLSPTSNNANGKETPARDSVTTTVAATSSSIQANINLDNCNANVNANLVNGNANNWHATTTTSTTSAARNISTAALASANLNPNSNIIPATIITAASASATNSLNTLDVSSQLNSNQFSNQNQTQNQNHNPNPNSNQYQNQNPNQNQTENHNQNHNQNRNRPSNVNSMNSINSVEQQNRNISSSLEIILSPIIQSSRRAQLLEK